ncbi:tumor necrosis factor receptor superfamily member 18 [Ambystoma mexicanum]|uniref:tumor necrosis factor receptor superfamily member 18 n=1 Tax=Ambystoma mexicanum TaxID=8296 RepID=UPI0037E79B58
MRAQRGYSGAALLAVTWLQGAWYAVLAVQCSPSQYPLPTPQGTKCCERCLTVVPAERPCPGFTDSDCKCTTGYKCKDPECSSCIPVPSCKKGEELLKSGSIDFSYRCKPCSNGTYSDKENGFCRVWSNCESQGLKTIAPGNRTHNVKCGVFEAFRSDAESAGLNTAILAVLTAVAIFILILGTIFLHLYIWRMKKEKLFIAEGIPCTSRSGQVYPHEDICSFQFPEEERGGKLATEDTADQTLASLKETSSHMNPEW